MFVDFRQSGPGASLDFDLCIVGSGPAGISLALEFIGSGIRVGLIEGGGMESDPDTQGLYAGEITGLPHTDLDACRLRYLGGSSNCWNGWCAPFDAHDFDAKPWVPHSGWPISKADLDPYYRRAGVACEIGPAEFEESYWAELGLDKPAFDPDRVALCHWRYSPPTRFGERYGDDLARADNITVLLHANATGIVASEDGNSVTGIEVASLTGKRATVAARHYVLACGGIEVPRLMLASNARHAKGISNQHDQVGRYFMEHPYATSGFLISKDADYLPDVEKIAGGYQVETCLCTPLEVQTREQVMGSALLFERQDNVESWFSWGNRDLPEPPQGYVAYTFLSQSEQAPNPQSRIMLSEKRDALGSPQARMDWQVLDIDKRSVTALVKQAGAEFARLGLGRVKFADWLLDGDAVWGMGAGNHHMGTTRMGDDPKTSVVDKDCRVHGIANLHVASSSVFTTSSWANPTLTIVALAIRLADRLKRDFG